MFRYDPNPAQSHGTFNSAVFAQDLNLSRCYAPFVSSVLNRDKPMHGKHSPKDIKSQLHYIRLSEFAQEGIDRFAHRIWRHYQNKRRYFHNIWGSQSLDCFDALPCPCLVNSLASRSFFVASIISIRLSKRRAVKFVSRYKAYYANRSVRSRSCANRIRLDIYESILL